MYYTVRCFVLLRHSEDTLMRLLVLLLENVIG